MRRLLKSFSKSLFRVLGTTVLAVLVIVCGTILLFLARPEILINGSTLQVAATFASKAGVDVTWDSVEVTFESMGFLKKRFQLDFSGVCVRERRAAAYRGCFDRARISGAGGLVHFLPRLTEMGPIALENGKARIDFERFEQGPPERQLKKPSRSRFRIERVIPIFMRNARVNSIFVSIPDWEIGLRDRRFRGSLLLDKKNLPPETIQLSARAVSQGKENGEASDESFRLNLRASNDRSFWAWNQWKIEGGAHARLADSRTIDVDLEALPRFKLARGALSQRPALHFSLKGKTEKDLQRIRAQVEGSFEPGQLEAKIAATAKNLVSEVPNIALQDCGIRISRTGTESESRYRLDCAVNGDVPNYGKSVSILELPTRIGLNVSADLESTDFFPTDTSELAGSVDVAINPILTSLIEGRAELHGKIAGVVGEFPRQGRIDTEVGIEVAVPDFRKLNDRLNRTRWGIPAPFQALEGSVVFRAGGSSNLEQGLIPLNLRTRLKSKSQNVNLDAHGTLALSDLRRDPNERLSFVLTLSDLKVILPRMKLEAPPRLTPDPRIHSFVQKPVQEKEEESSFGFRGVIRTPPDKPAQVVTNLAKAPIPVHLDLTVANDSPLVGKIAVGAFPVEAFRRKGSVDHFDIALEPEFGNSPINGRIDVPVGDYKTHIELVGAIDKPQVKVTSDPPVGEDQLLAALLFNRAPEELDPSQSAAVGSTRASVSQGALSLASIFLLASTPIEGLIYNPETGAVTAQVRLAEGLSLNLGSGENQSGAVGLRKRLGANFFVTTDVNNIIRNTSTASAYLEWRKRY